MYNCICSIYMYVCAIYCMYLCVCVCVFADAISRPFKDQDSISFPCISYRCRRPKRRPLRRPLSWRSAPMRRHRPPQMQLLPKRQRCIPKWPRARRIRVSAMSSSLAARKATMTTTRRRCPLGVSRSSRSR